MRHSLLRSVVVVLFALAAVTATAALEQASRADRIKVGAAAASRP